MLYYINATVLVNAILMWAANRDFSFTLQGLSVGNVQDSLISDMNPSAT